MTPSLWFAPNAQSDILALFQRPDEWAAARAQCDVFQFYSGAILSDAKYVPNTYESLVQVKAFSQLRAWKIPVAIESGAVKDWSPDGKNGLRGTKEAITRIRLAQGSVTTITMDEPRNAGKTLLNQTVEETAAHTATYVVGLRDLGLHLDITLIEPYPALPMAEILKFVELMQTEGGGPSGLTLDIDRYGLKDQGIDQKQFARDVLEAQRRCRDWQIPLGIILFGQRVTTAKAYRDDVLAWTQRVRDTFGQTSPDRLIVQSWEVGPSGKKDLPHNTPEADRTSHAAVITHVAQLVQSGAS